MTNDISVIARLWCDEQLRWSSFPGHRTKRRVTRSSLARRRRTRYGKFAGMQEILSQARPFQRSASDHTVSSHTTTSTEETRPRDNRQGFKRSMSDSMPTLSPCKEEEDEIATSLDPIWEVPDDNELTGYQRRLVLLRSLSDPEIVSSCPRAGPQQSQPEPERGFLRRALSADDGDDPAKRRDITEREITVFRRDGPLPRMISPEKASSHVEYCEEECSSLDSTSSTTESPSASFPSECSLTRVSHDRYETSTRKHGQRLGVLLTFNNTVIPVNPVYHLMTDETAISTGQWNQTCR